MTLHELREQAARIRDEYQDARRTAREYADAAEATDDYSQFDAYSDEYGSWCEEWLYQILHMIYGGD